MTRVEPSGIANDALDPNMSGPLGASLIQLLTDPVNGLVLGSWLTADGELGGEAAILLQGR